MTKYKRNQVEDAIFQTFRARGARIDELRFRLKRLLATDRRLGRQPKAASRGDRQYAFFSQEPPGKGTEITFSHYEAFSILAAIMLLEHGLSQGRVVRLMRQARRQLEAAHTRTLKRDPRDLFDQQAILAQAKPGMIASDATHPIYLVFVKLTDSAVGEPGGRVPVAVCEDQAGVMAFMHKHSELGSGVTIFQFARLIHTFATRLMQTCPIKRGRRADYRS